MRSRLPSAPSRLLRLTPTFDGSGQLRRARRHPSIYDGETITVGQGASRRAFAPSRRRLLVAVAPLALLAACGQRGELLGTTTAGTAVVVPQRLRSELRDSPLGIQTATPRLSWELAA